MSNQDDNKYKGMELYEDYIKVQEAREESVKEQSGERLNKRSRDEEDNDNEEPEAKRQKVYHVSSRSSSETSDSVSDDGEESETERINTKYSKRFDAIEDYKEKNELLSEMSIKNVMNKLDEIGRASCRERV